LKFGKLITEKIILYKFFDFKKHQSLFYYRDFFCLYGLFFENFCDKVIVIYKVPAVLYNLLINWHRLLSDLVFFLDNSIVSHFSINRLDMNVIDIFIKNLHKKSPFYKFDVDYIYNELLCVYNEDRDWFLKNCFEVSYGKAEKK
jgi:hypothetical protein